LTVRHPPRVLEERLGKVDCGLHTASNISWYG
jgi:hypothetical protein